MESKKPNKQTTLEQLSKNAKEDAPASLSTVSEPPLTIDRSSEDKQEWRAQFWIKLALVSAGVLITGYGGYLATRVLLVYKDILLTSASLGKALPPFQSGVAFLIIPIFIAGITFVLAAAKLLTKHNKDDEDSSFDKLIAAINPVLNAINLYLKSKTHS